MSLAGNLNVSIKSSNQYGTRIKITAKFDGHYFGTGSFLSRAVSSEGDYFFPRTILPHPTIENISEIKNKINKLSETCGILGVFIEPIGQKTGQFVSEELLKELRVITEKNGIPLIFNETNSKLYAYDETSFYASCENLKPDAIMTYHGGQLATVNICEKYFLDQPLMLISTWDGDEFSANLAYEEYLQVDLIS